MPIHERHVEEAHYSLRQEINELYIMIATRNFAIALLGVFVPIFVFLYFDKAIIPTLLFYVAQFAGHILLVPLSAKLIGKLGLKKCMALGTPFLGAYLVLLVLAENYGFSFIILSIIAKIIYMNLYWPSRHIDFARFASKQKRGTQIGIANVISAVMKTIAPLIGGIAIVQFGFTPLFVFSSILLLVSTLPLFASAEVFEHYSLSWRESFMELFSKKNKTTAIAYFFEGIEYGVGIFLFPVFIFLVISEIDTIGWITSASLALALLITYLVGRVSDTKGELKVISIASVAHALAWPIMAFITTPLHYLFSNSLYRVTETANHLPFTSYFYKTAHKRGHGIDEFVVFHEIAHNIGRVTMALIAIIGFSLGITSFFYYFLIAGIAALLFRMVR